VTKDGFRLGRAHVHFIGIGGIGMCGLAELLFNMGAVVTGSDAGENRQTERLESLGIIVYKGHDASFLGTAEVVVYSSAVRSTNVEIAEARRRGIPLIRRAEALAEIMRLKRGLAIAGTHGKTTTTSLAASIFLEAGLDPTIVIGGRLDLIKSTAQLGQGEWLVAEADESDGSFNRLAPEVVVITNIDNDHLDHFGDMKSLRLAYLEFAQRIPFYGAAIVCGDDPETKKLFHDFPKKIIFYGEGADNDVVVAPLNDGYTIQAGDSRTEFKLPIPGRHNALNASAAILAAREAGVQLEIGAKAVANFKGVDRRFQHKATVRGIDYYDDYGHHPTEIKAVLSAFKEHFPPGGAWWLYFNRTAIHALSFAGVSFYQVLRLPINYLYWISIQVEKRLLLASQRSD
jgi:UDP-N-acetylmuramate--alanine ligase